jgi:hypothetical protein
MAVFYIFFQLYDRFALSITLSVASLAPYALK